MKHRVSTLILAGGMACLLTGCLFKGADQLYALPKLSDDYTNLQDVLSGLVDSGLEYAAPKSGSNTQAIQFRDLDGDGEDEVIAFFRESSGSKPLKIYIFQQTESELYAIQTILEGDGTAFHSIAYVDINGTDALELAVNYQISDQVYTLNVYSLDGGGVSRLLQAGCTHYAVGDLNGDGLDELILIQQEDTQEDGDRAQWYRWVEGELEPSESVSLSAGITSIQRVRTSCLAGGEAAVFVTGSYGEGDDLLVTDVLAVQQGALANVTLNETTGVSDSSLRRDTGEDIFATDLDGDGIYEIPFATELTELGSSGVWSVDWIQYRLDGTQNRVCTTICSPKDGWYLALPESLRGTVGAVRWESTVSDEVSVTLYDRTGPTEPEAVVTISQLTGANRGVHAKQGQRFVLNQGTEAIYVGELESDRWSLTQEDLIQQFHFMPVNWSSAD